MARAAGLLIAAWVGGTVSASAQQPVVVGGSGLPAVEVHLDVLGVFDGRGETVERPPLPGATAPSEPIRLRPPGTVAANDRPQADGRIKLKPPPGVSRLRLPPVPVGDVQSAPILRPPKLVTARRAEPPAEPVTPAPRPREPVPARPFGRSIAPELIVVPPPRAAAERTPPEPSKRAAGTTRGAPQIAHAEAPRRTSEVARAVPRPVAPVPEQVPPASSARPREKPTRIAKLPPPPKVERPTPPEMAPTKARPAPPAVPPAPARPAPVAKEPPPPTKKTVTALPPPTVPPAAKAPPPPIAKAPPPPPPAAAPAPERDPAIQTARLEPPSSPAPRSTVLAPAPRRSESDPLLSLAFGGESAQLSSRARQQLAGLADKLTGTDSRLQLKAYASASGGTASAARRLSLSRALSVRSYLIEKGVRSTRIDVRALGLADDGGPEDRVDVLLFER